MDLSAYLARIGQAGRGAGGREALDELLVAHMRAIPFENIDVIVRGQVSLDRADLFDKLVTRRRGGYCYEHGLLLAEVLRQMNYAVELMTARVRLRSRSGDPPTARTHLALRVDVDGLPYLVDPGFGGPGPQFAMPMEQDVEFVGLGGTFRFVSAAVGHWSLQRQSGEQFADIYHLDPVPVAEIDVEVANHYTATHPSSPFTQMLWVRTIETDGSRSIVNRELAINRRGQRQVLTLSSKDELVRVLHDEFDLDVPELGAANVPGFD